MKNASIILYSLLAASAIGGAIWFWKKQSSSGSVSSGKSDGLAPSGSSASSPSGSVAPQELPKIDVKTYSPPVGEKTPLLVVANAGNIAPDTPKVAFDGSSYVVKTNYLHRMDGFQSDY